MEPKYLPSISGDLAAASGFRPRLRAARRRDHLCRAQLGHLVIDCCGTGLADLGRQWGGRGDSVTLGRERQVVCSGQDRRNQGKVWFPTEVYSTSGQHEPARPLEFGSLGLQMKSRSLLAICTNIVGSNACACNSGDSGDGGKCTLNSQPAWEFSIDSEMCSCPNSRYIVRPCIDADSNSNPNWGGMNSNTCNTPPDTRSRVRPLT